MNIRHRVPLIVLACVTLLSSHPALAQFSQQGQKLVGMGAVGNAFQGSSVSISGDGNTAIVGGPFDNSQSQVGAAWIWTRSAGAWTQQGPKLIGSGIVGPYAYQGGSVSISADGNTALVGGTEDDYTAGAVWVWTRSGGVWTQQGPKLVGSGAVGPFAHAQSQQGRSVSLSADGNTALIGGGADNNGAGAVWVWTRSGGAWTQQGPKLVGSGAVGNAQQGSYVSLSADGNTALVAGPGDNRMAIGDGVHNLRGAAWVWTRSGGVWTQQGSKLVGSDAVENAQRGWGAQQGCSVSLSGDGNTAIIGGCGDNPTAIEGGGIVNHDVVGASWVWTRNGGVWTQQGPKLVATGTAGNAHQGWSVSLSNDGNTALVGGPADNSMVGAVWVWTRSGGVWRQLGTKLVGSGIVGPGASQGVSVSLSGDSTTAIVGGEFDNNFAGAAWVFAALPVVPAITTQPQNQTAVGANATFTFAASGTPLPTLQWQVSTNGGSSWSDLANNNLYSGVATGILVITGAPIALNGYQYRGVATNSSGSIYSTAAVLTVNCSMSLSPAASPLISAAGGTGSFGVATPGGCPWTASAGASWISFASPASGSGNGAVDYSVQANPSSQSRSGTITVASQRIGTVSIADSTITVTQTGATPVFTLNPTSSTLGASASTNIIQVTVAPADASWFARSNDAWITITSGYSGGIGSGVVQYSVAANSSAARRVGTLNIAGVAFVVTQAGVGPQISRVSNSASGAMEAQSGSWVSIYGSNLSATTREWRISDFSGNNLPTVLDGVRVIINGKDAAISYISPGQLNVQAPTDETVGRVQVQVSNSYGSAVSNLILQQYSPGFFIQGKYVAAVHADGTYVAPTGFFGGAAVSRPASPGEILLVYGTGFGPTSPAFLAGRVVIDALPLTDPSQLQVRIGGLPSAVLFAGMVLPGEYQFNVLVPSLAEGDYAIVAEIGGLSTQPGVLIPIMNK